MYSETIRAFQPPPQACMLPMRIAGKDAGIRIPLMKRRPRIRYAAVASSKSFGTLFTAPTILNNKYHCIPVRIKRTEARLRVNPRYGEFLNGLTSSITTIGNRAVAGIDCPMSKIGTSNLDSLWLLAISMPAARVHERAIAYAITNLDSDRRVRATSSKAVTSVASSAMPLAMDWDRD